MKEKPAGVFLGVGRYLPGVGIYLPGVVLDGHIDKVLAFHKSKWKVWRRRSPTLNTYLISSELVNVHYALGATLPPVFVTKTTWYEQGKNGPCCLSDTDWVLQVKQVCSDQPCGTQVALVTLVIDEGKEA